MSYDIYFIKKKGITASEIDVLLEGDVKSSDDHYVSKELMVSIHQKLSQEGLIFEIFESHDSDGDYYELNFPTYQVSIFNSMIAISLPYWDANSESEIDMEVQTITFILTEFGFLTYDPQTNEVTEGTKSVSKNFTETKEYVEKRINTNEESSNNNLSYLWIGLGIIIVSLIIWKVVRR